MSNWDEVTYKPGDADTKAAGEPAPLRSGGYPNELIDDRDTAPVAYEGDEFDETEITRAEQPRFALAELEGGSIDISSAALPTLSAVANPVIDASDDWGGWDPENWDEFWMRVHAIEAAGNESDEALFEALVAHGLADKAHFDRVRDSFTSAYGDDPAFMQAAIDARTRGTKQAMQARMTGELKGELAPFDGVSLEQWAWLMAKIASGGNPTELLALAKMNDAKWQRVSAEWNARMSRDTTATIATAYGQAFVATGPGPFGESGKQTAAAMLDPNQRGVAGGPPIPMEKWIEITEAQGAASRDGEDAAALLASYGLSPADWGVIGGWWSQHFNANAMKLIGEYNRLSDHYRKKFGG